MAVPLLAIVMAAASLGANPYESAQIAYSQCLSNEVDAAVTRRVDSDSFAAGAAQVCADQTAVYRRMAVAGMIGQGMAGASPAAASQRFDQTDRTNRAEMIADFENRMRLRRGPARIAGLPVRTGAQD